MQTMWRQWQQHLESYEQEVLHSWGTPFDGIEYPFIIDQCWTLTDVQEAREEIEKLEERMHF